MNKTRIGIMGFGRIGRQIYQQSLKDPQFEVVAISDIGQPEILHNLLSRTDKNSTVKLENNYLVSAQGKTRLMPANQPTEIPWDVFGADFVIDATGKFREKNELIPHVSNGAKHVIMSTLPVGEVDRVILRGVNDKAIKPTDRVISAGSASTTATALILKVIATQLEIVQATMTSVHAYTSDQSLQDYAGLDYRRSRSGAKNIIPNDTPALEWVQRVLPALDGKLSAYALNVPVQVGSMLDVTVAFADASVTTDAVNQLFIDAARELPELIATTDDPIVSSDVRGSTRSLLLDQKGTTKAGQRMIKLLAWHETRGHAQRLLDVAQLYASLDNNAVRASQQEAS